MRLRLAGWDGRARADLGRIRDFRPRDLAVLRRHVEAGRWFLFAIEADGRRVGSLVWSVEVEGDGEKSLIVNGIGAEPVPGLDVVALVLAEFEAMGRKIGARALRFWTSREGLRARMERAGFSRRYVMERELA